MRQEVERPNTDMVSEEAARAWLATQGLTLTGRAFEELMKRPRYAKGVRSQNRENRFLPWKLVLMVLWDYELGLIPEGPEDA